MQHSICSIHTIVFPFPFRLILLLHVFKNLRFILKPENVHIRPRRQLEFLQKKDFLKIYLFWKPGGGGVVGALMKKINPG
jgi:hypothetical protein